MNEIKPIDKASTSEPTRPLAAADFKPNVIYRRPA